MEQERAIEEQLEALEQAMMDQVEKEKLRHIQRTFGTGVGTNAERRVVAQAQFAAARAFTSDVCRAASEMLTSREPHRPKLTFLIRQGLMNTAFIDS